MAMNSNISPAGMALGFNFGRTGVAASTYGNPGGGLGDLLGQQVGQEAEEERRRRLLGLSVAQSGSPAMKSLLGGGLGGINRGV